MRKSVLVMSLFLMMSMASIRRREEEDIFQGIYYAPKEMVYNEDENEIEISLDELFSDHYGVPGSLLGSDFNQPLVNLKGTDFYYRVTVHPS